MCDCVDGGFSKMRKNGTAEGDVNVWVEIAQNSGQALDRRADSLQVKRCVGCLGVSEGYTLERSY